ncbi:MAG TPA: response regulator [Desulfobacterales bacterium]|nr:response regulator [Desulfobacterales bacterium]
MTSILLVDDEGFFRQRLARAFKKRGYEVLEAADYNQAMVRINSCQPQLAVVDLKMPGKSGLELIRDGLKSAPKLQIVVLTGYGSIATATEAIKLGAIYYLPKPADVDDILAAFAKSDGNEISTPVDFKAPSLARAEWEHINRVLDDCGGNISAAARRLGLHRRTLQRKLQKYPPAT